MEAAHDRCNAWWSAPIPRDAVPKDRHGRRNVERDRCRALVGLVTPGGNAPVSRTHSHGQAGVAVGPTGSRVGIDLEREIDRDFLSLSELAFSPAEHQWLLDLPPGERRRSFYSLWTLKEAFAKALGLDLCTALASCRFAPTPVGFAAVVPTTAHWSAEVFSPFEGYRMAVVSLAPAGATRAAPIVIAGIPGVGCQSVRETLRAVRC